jgi:hypothetical protein
MSRVGAENAASFSPPTCLWTYQSRAGRHCFIFSTPHILILLAAFLMLGTVAPAASANIAKSPSVLNDAGHSAAHTHGFLLAEASCSSLKSQARSRLKTRVGQPKPSVFTLTTAGPRRVLRPRRTAEVSGGICRAHIREGERGGREAYEKAKEVVEEGKARGSLMLKGFEKRVEVGGREHLVRVIDRDAELEESQGGKKLL